MHVRHAQQKPAKLPENVVRLQKQLRILLYFAPFTQAVLYICVQKQSGHRSGGLNFNNYKPPVWKVQRLDLLLFWQIYGQITGQMCLMEHDPP